MLGQIIYDLRNIQVKIHIVPTVVMWVLMYKAPVIWVHVAMMLGL